VSEKIRPPETASSHSRDAENSMTGQGQQIIAVALGGPYTRPRIALEPSFPWHGLSKLSRRILKDSSTSTSGTSPTTIRPTHRTIVVSSFRSMSVVNMIALAQVFSSRISISTRIRN